LSDPTVELNVDGTPLKLPLSHSLPRTRRRYPGYAENLGQLARILARLGGTTMIDVGANVGDSAAIVKAHAPSLAILCVEADPSYIPFLHSNTARWTDVEVAAPVLLSDKAGPVDGSLVRAEGTSRFVTSTGNSTRASTLEDVVSKWPAFAHPCLLKSDTDGFEEKVLHGATQILAESGPSLFLEYDPRMLSTCGSTGLGILSWLRQFGYDRILYYDKFGNPMIRASLADEALLQQLDEYAARDTVAGIDQYDVVVTTPRYTSVIDELAISSLGTAPSKLRSA
jgi:FkbM family methyltransferase